MKFVCSNCSTQYLISDDKVGSKGVKVRCKRCGNVIIVRPPSFDDEAAEPLATDPGLSGDRSDESPDSFDREDGDEVGQAFDQLLAGGLAGDDEEDGADDDGRATEVFKLNDVNRSEPSFDDDRDKIDQVFAGAESTELRRNTSSAQDKAEWYVAIGDEQLGPVSVAEIEARWRDGEVDGKTLSWCPGMDSWLPMQEVEALSALVELPAPEARGKTDVDSPMPGEELSSQEEGDQWAPYQGSELASLVEEEMAAVASSPPPEEEEEGDILGGPLDDNEEIPPWEQEAPPSGAVAKPDDSFFDSTLDSSSESGAGGTYGRSGVLAGPAYLGTPKRQSSKGKWIIVGVLSGIILLGGAIGIYFMSLPPEKHQEDLQAVVPPDVSSHEAKASNKDSKKKDKPSDSAKLPETSKNNTKDGGIKSDAKKENGKSEKGKGSREMVVAKPSVDTKKDVTRSHKQQSNKKNRGKKRKKKKGSGSKNTKTLTLPKNNSSSSASASVDSGLPKKLSKTQIGKTMMEYVQSMRSCVQDQHRRDPTVTGVMKVSFTIQADGRVKGIRVLTKEHSGTYVAGCIKYIIKSIHFPKAQGISKVPVLPLKLGG